jgi:hypothetical protein
MVESFLVFHDFHDPTKFNMELANFQEQFLRIGYVILDLRKEHQHIIQPIMIIPDDLPPLACFCYNHDC